MLKNIDNKLVKFDPLIIRAFPSSTGRKRIENWSAEREYNGFIIEIKAPVSLNGYDYIAFFQMLYDYSINKNKWKYQGSLRIDDETERILMKRTFDLTKLAEERGLTKNKNNRESISRAFHRWFQAELTYKYKEEQEDIEIKTRYIYEYKIDKKKQKITITANTSFFDDCLNGGMLMNWGRLLKYRNNNYALELDIYLQFNSIKYMHGRKRKYAYPNVVREETLFNSIGLDNEIKYLKHKREKLKKAFQKFEEVTGIKYIYSRLERKWIKESYFLRKQKN